MNEQNRRIQIDEFWSGYWQELTDYFGVRPTKIYKNEVEVEGKIKPIPKHLNRNRV